MGCRPSSGGGCADGAVARRYAADPRRPSRTGVPEAGLSTARMSRSRVKRLAELARLLLCTGRAQGQSALLLRLEAKCWSRRVDGVGQIPGDTDIAAVAAVLGDPGRARMGPIGS